MRTGRPPLRLIALLCVITLQVQAWAAASLPCRYSAMHAGAAQAACPFHHGKHQPAPSRSPGASFDCHKCMLECRLGLYHPVTGGTGIARALTLSEPTALAEHHFYRLAPDRLLRPPIVSPIS